MFACLVFFTHGNKQFFHNLFYHDCRYTILKKVIVNGFFLNQGREVQDIYMNILSPVL